MKKTAQAVKVKKTSTHELLRLLGLLILFAGVAGYLYPLSQGTATQTDAITSLLFTTLSALYLYISGMQKK